MSYKIDIFRADGMIQGVRKISAVIRISKALCLQVNVLLHAAFVCILFVLVFNLFLSPSGILFGFIFPVVFHLKTYTFLRPILGFLFYGFWALSTFKIKLSL